MIELANVSYQIGERQVFAGLSYRFEAGQLYVLKGDSGSGKSTLMRLIAGFAGLDYTGTIKIDANTLREADMAAKARNVGMMFQNPARQFTMGTLRREVIFALENLQLSPDLMPPRLQQAVTLAQTEESRVGACATVGSDNGRSGAFAGPPTSQLWREWW